MQVFSKPCAVLPEPVGPVLTMQAAIQTSHPTLACKLATDKEIANAVISSCAGRTAGKILEGSFQWVSL